MVSQKPIHAKSKHHIGDMYVHKKHRFVVQILSRGEWSGNRLCKVVHGEVPPSVLQRVQRYHGSSPYEKLRSMFGENVALIIEYNTCTLSQCFDKLKAGQVLFG